MGLLFDPNYVDLTADAPIPDRDHAEQIARAYATVTRAAEQPSEGFSPLFDGGGIERWATAGRGAFVVVDDRLESVPGDDLGLFWHTEPTPADFVLRLEWLRWRHEDASGVFVRFPRPDGGPDGNPAFTAIQSGFEVQIVEVGLPGAAAIHRTGAIFDQRGQRLRSAASRPPVEWNEFEITVRGQQYSVRLNGQPATEFTNRNPRRGLPSTPTAPSYIGLQIYPGSRVAFRRIRIKALEADEGSKIKDG
jgi:hypothetical protein